MRVVGKRESKWGHNGWGKSSRETKGGRISPVALFFYQMSEWTNTYGDSTEDFITVFGGLVFARYILTNRQGLL